MKLQLFVKVYLCFQKNLTFLGSKFWNQNNYQISNSNSFFHFSDIYSFLVVTSCFFLSKIINKEIKNKTNPIILYLNSPPITGTVRPIKRYNVRVTDKLNKSTFKFFKLIDLLNNRNNINTNKAKFSNEANRNIKEPLARLKGFINTFLVAFRLDSNKLGNESLIVGSV